MPLFNRKAKGKEDYEGQNGFQRSPKNSPKPSPHSTRAAPRTNGHIPATPPSYKAAAPPPPNSKSDLSVQRPKLVFHCQQAQGSPTGLISGFSNVKELYQKIADCYDIPVSDVIFCTLNTHKVDMNRLLGGQIGLDDFIFVHRRGQPKELEVTKTEDALGLTITDNGAGYAFIKRIKEGSIIDRLKHVQVGDLIEKINEKSLVGCRHFEVARMLKEIELGSVFTMRMVEPLKAGFSNIGPRSDGKPSKKGYGSGKATLRFKSTGPAVIEEAPDDVVEKATAKINMLLENFLGINDNELATQIWELGEGKTNTMEFAEAIDNSDLEDFGFSDDFVFELWGAMSDAKAGRS